MARGFSIHVGINNLSDHYDAGQFGTLTSCIKDATDMQHIAEDQLFEKITPLPDASVNKFKLAVREASGELKSGDMCLITFSGHGAQAPDENSDETDDRQKDETWCFHDRQLLDDEILDLVTDFRKGVRVLVISDSCNSGTIIDQIRFFRTNINRFLLLRQGFNFRSMENLILRENGLNFIELDEISVEKNFALMKKTRGLNSKVFESLKSNIFEERVKSLPRVLFPKIIADHQSVYDEARSEARENLNKKLRDRNEENFQDLKGAGIQLISACQDGQSTQDGKLGSDNSVFTRVLRSVWNSGNFSKNYIEFHKDIHNIIKGENRPQSPCRYSTGDPNFYFELERPFTLNPAVNPV